MNSNCANCDEVLEVDGDGDPYTYGPDDDLCWDCHHELNEFTCCGCEEYGHVTDQHNFCVAFEKGYGVAPGIYRIIDTPYYWSDMLSGGLFAHSLELIASLPFNWIAYTSVTGKKVYHELTHDPMGYPIGHLCFECQKAMLNQVRKSE